jgi:A nuclease family of the HNH/ENDO VII superfamily with conserved AHH
MSEEKGHIKALQSHESHKPGKQEGCVTKCWQWNKEKYRSEGPAGHNWRENGVEYQSGNEKNWYNLDFSTEGPARARLERELKKGRISLRTKRMSPLKPQDREMWWLSTGKNFKGWRKPWDNQAHHVIPVESLHAAFSDEIEPGESALLLLQQAKYNVNAGVNVMLLPVQEAYARVFELPVHRGGHKSYSELVERQLDSLKNVIREAEAQDGDHPALSKDNFAGLKTELENFSLSMREVLREVGVVRAKANELREPDNFLSHSINIVD